MVWNEKLYRKIMKKHKKTFEDLEEYDKTREWLIGKKRIDITLSKRLIKRLREVKEKTGKPISQIIEEALIEKV